jgi:hypothetical protein
MEMRYKSLAYLAAFILLFLGTAVAGDLIVLKDGTSYSGTFVRGDSLSVEFRVLGNVVKFKIEDVAQIRFTETEAKSTTAANASASANTPAKAKASLSPNLPRSQGVNKTEPQLVDKSVRHDPVRTMGKTNPVPEAVTLPSGTMITIRTISPIDTNVNKAGDTFDAILDEALTFGEKTVVSRGSTVRGRIAYAKESGKLAGQSQLILELTELVVDNKSYLLRTSDYSEVGASRGNRTAATVGGTAALGAIIGAIAGGGKGAAIGAASGAAVGTGVQVLTKGQTLKIPAETILEFRLQFPLTLESGF